MNYAKISNLPFVAQKKVMTSRHESASAKSIREFCHAHSVSITIDPDTKKGSVVLKENER